MAAVFYLKEKELEKFYIPEACGLSRWLLRVPPSHFVLPTLAATRYCSAQGKFTKKNILLAEH